MMEILNITEKNSISGGANLVVTKLIPTDGLSNICVNTLLHIFQNANAQTLTEDQIDAQISSSCSESEINLIFERIDAIAPYKVEFI